MSNQRKVTFIGFWILLAVIALYFGITYLKGLDVFSDSYKYYIRFKNVSGLSVASPVKVNGFKIGNVSRLQFDMKLNGTTLVEMSIKKKYKIPKNSSAIVKQGIIDGAEIAVTLGNSSDFLEKEDTLQSGLPGMDYVEVLNNEVIPAIKRLIPKADSILTAWNKISNNPAIPSALKDVQISIEHTKRAMKNIEQSSYKLNDFAHKDIPELSENIRKFSRHLTSVSSAVDSTQLSGIVKNLESSVQELRNFSKSLNQKDNSVGLLFNDTGMYYRIDSLVESTEKLISDIKENPKKYLKISIF